jgi:hypothetical protein
MPAWAAGRGEEARAIGGLYGRRPHGAPSTTSPSPPPRTAASGSGGTTPAHAGSCSGARTAAPRSWEPPPHDGAARLAGRDHPTRPRRAARVHRRPRPLLAEREPRRRPPHADVPGADRLCDRRRVITVRVTDAGDPVPAATVRIGGRALTTDAGGQVTLSLPRVLCRHGVEDEVRRGRDAGDEHPSLALRAVPSGRSGRVVPPACSGSEQQPEAPM